MCAGDDALFAQSGKHGGNGQQRQWRYVLEPEDMLRLMAGSAGR